MVKKYFFLPLLFLLSTFSAIAQNRNTTVKILNNYLLYSDANVTALTELEHSLERYNDLFNTYLRKNRKLGGEEYEKPKPSPFLSEDLFNINEDDPATLYSKAIKESAALPVATKTELNNTMKSLRGCSQKLVALVDSMSNLFSGPLITVTKNETIAPYSLLAEARNQLQLSKKYRGELFASIAAYYKKTCPLTTANGDYIRSVDQLTKGMVICQKMMDDLSKNDSTRISHYVNSLDSLNAYLDKEELTLLKGIHPFGNSKHFPSSSTFNGFDLYAKYERIMDGFRIFSDYGKSFLKGSDRDAIHKEKFYSFHAKCARYFNGYGLCYNYNEYVLLIGGGKMKVDSDVGTLWKGWGDGKYTLPVRTLLFWTKETPRFEIEWPAH